MYKLDKLFRTASRYNASDLYFSTGTRPVLRINGELIIIKEHEVVSAEMAQEFLLELLNPEQQKDFAINKEIDLSINVKDIARFRVNIYTQRRGISGSFRLIPETVPTMDELAVPQQLKKLTNKRDGLIIVTGPTGSGKSSTLASLADEINSTQKKHIITIEDPIEFVYENKQSIIEQREVGTHTNSFKSALRASLREDPDVILIGEMRDLETIQLAITAAETGHLVLGTLHTSGAAKAVDRMIDVFPPEQQNQVRMQLAESLQAIIWQALLQTRDKRGRIGAFEILLNNTGVANMIRKEKTHQISSAIEIGMKEGMQSMHKALQDLLAAGVITQDEANLHIPKDYENGE